MKDRSNIFEQIKTIIIIYIVIFVANTMLADSDKKQSIELASRYIDNWTNISYRSFTDKDGLPQNSIIGIVFDDDGYLWVGTHNGIARYDGANFFNISLTTLIGKPVSNVVIYMNKSNDGRIWIVNNDGITIRGKNNLWEEVVVPYKSSKERILYISDATTAKNNSRYIIATQKQMFILENNKWFTVDALNTFIDTKLPNKKIGIMKIVQRETSDKKLEFFLWLGNSKIYVYRNNGLEDLKLSFGDNTWITNILIGKLERDNNELIVATNNGATIYNLKDKSYKKIYENKTSGIKTNFFANKIWKTYSQNGEDFLWFLDFLSKKIIKHNLALGTNTITQLENNLPKNDILSVAERSSNNITKDVWLGTDGAGLIQIRNNVWSELSINKNFENLSPSKFLETTDNLNNKILWIGTFGEGLLQLKNELIKKFDVNNNFCNNYVLDMFEVFDKKTQKKILWVATSNGLGRIADDNIDCYTLDILEDSHPTANWIRAIHETIDASEKATLWVGTEDRLLKIDDNDFKTIQEVPHHFKGSINTIFSTKKGGKDILWIGTDEGLLKYEDGKITQEYKHLKNSFHSHILSYLLYDNPSGKKEVWIGTQSGGIAIANLDDLINNKPNWKIISQNNFKTLPDNTIYSIVQDNKYRIYIFTNKGVIRFNSSPYSTPVDKIRTYTFDINDGLPSNEFNTNAAYYSTTGHIFAGTIKGVVAYNLNNEFLSNEKTSFHLFSYIVEDGNKKALSNNILSYKENNLEFDFRLLSFFKEGTIKYSYQLQGLDPKPSPWSSLNQKGFTTLPSGSYSFNLWAKDHEDNVIGPKTIPFTITPAPWKTWWAYSIYVSSSLFIVYSFIKYRTYSLKKKNLLLEEKIRERTNELSLSNTKLQDSISELDEKNIILDRKNAELGQKNEELLRSHEELLVAHKRSNRIFSALAEALPGTTLDDKYQLEESIGVGGFSTVFRGFDIRLKRHVAIKVFKPSSNNATQENLERFVLEGVSVCKITHPNAVVVLDTGISNDAIPYLVMELLKGKTLSDEMKQKIVIDPVRCWQIIKPVCELLVFVHKMGIIHRDVKPDNIFLHSLDNKNETIKVLDFGIAKVIEDSINMMPESPATLTGNIFGTPLYMAPERLSGNNYDGKVDVYSIGLIMHKMLTGRDPFQTNMQDPISIAMAHLSAPPIPIEMEFGKFSSSLSNAISMLLKKDPQERPTMSEAIDYLEEAISNNPISDMTVYNMWVETRKSYIHSASSLSTVTNPFNNISTKQIQL